MKAIDIKAFSIQRMKESQPASQPIAIHFVFTIFFGFSFLSSDRYYVKYLLERENETDSSQNVRPSRKKKYFIECSLEN